MLYREYNLQKKIELSSNEEINTTVNSGTVNMKDETEKFSDEVSPSESKIEKTTEIEATGSKIEEKETGAEETDISTSTGSEITSSGTSNPNAINYYNPSYKYGFDMPKKVFFNGFGPQNGANHSVGIFTSSGTTDFTQATVKVFFYKKEILEEAKNLEDGEKIYTDGKYYIKSGVDTIVVEGDKNSDITNAVVDTIKR
ncbi:MAG: hypothetical protein PHO80_03730 [Candidatus Gracilibacteria bacterium]|nr:hypothetical protein [Candidatus Gracilibacteria bacterium]